VEVHSASSVGLGVLIIESEVGVEAVVFRETCAEGSSTSGKGCVESKGVLLWVVEKSGDSSRLLSRTGFKRV